MFAQIVVNFDTLFRQFGVQDLRYRWDTPTATGTRFGFRFQRRNGMTAFVDSGNQHAFGDIEAGANLRAIRQFIDTDRRLTAARVCWQNQ